MNNLQNVIVHFLMTAYSGEATDTNTLRRLKLDCNKQYQCLPFCNAKNKWKVTGNVRDILSYMQD
jgi:hypothetical protein